MNISVLQPVKHLNSFHHEMRWDENEKLRTWAQVEQYWNVKWWKSGNNLHHKSSLKAVQCARSVPCNRVTASTQCRDQSRSPLYCSELAVMILSVPEMVSPGLYTTLLWLKVMSKSCSLPIVSRCRSAREAKRVRFGLIRAVDGGVSRDVAPAAFPPLSLHPRAWRHHGVHGSACRAVCRPCS